MDNPTNRPDANCGVYVRQRPIEIKWTSDLIGRLTINGRLWTSVEWSEKRQAWCIEDAEGRCLSHQAHVHGVEADKAAAVALAEAMIRDGRMPDPETARQARAARHEKRRQQPAQIRKREERAEALRRWSAALIKEWPAKQAEEQAPPLYETLADVFDFADSELWKSNSFAALRPRLATHVRAVVTKLESDLVRTTMHGRSQETRELQRLNRAREILRALEGEAP